MPVVEEWHNDLFDISKHSFFVGPVINTVQNILPTWNVSFRMATIGFPFVNHLCW